MDDGRNGRRSLEQAVSALVARISDVPPQRVEITAALGRISAEAVATPSATPPSSIALYEGWAVAAEDTVGASVYAPAFSSAPPHRIAAGARLPDFADAVLPLPNGAQSASALEILGAVAPGEGVRSTGSDLRRGEIIVAAGARLEARHIALMRTAGVRDALVRIPRVHIVSCCAAGDWLADLARRQGADCSLDAVRGAEPPRPVEPIGPTNADLVIIVDPDGWSRPIAREERMLFSGVAMRPGETMSCVVRLRNISVEKPGRNSDCDPASSRELDRSETPVIFIGDRLESALAAWLLLVQPCLRRLARATFRDFEECRPLTRKIVSAPGLSELSLLRRVASGDAASAQWEPLATGDIPYSAIASADAWLLVGPQAEGFAAGQIVAAQLL